MTQARITEDDLKCLVPSEDSLGLHIETANLLVNEEIVAGSLSDDRMAHIELYLAAHFAKLAEGGQTSFEKVGDAAESVGGKFDTGLQATLFGQQALLMDTTGGLSKIASSAKKAEFRVV